MNLIELLWRLAAVAFCVWLFSRLVRSPRDVPLWAVTVLIACWAAAWPFEEATDAQNGVLGLAPLTCLLVQHLLVQAGATCLVYFFLFSALEFPKARGLAVRYTLPLLVVGAVQTVAVLSAPAGARTRDFTVVNVMIVYLVGVAYMCLVFVLSFVWTRRYARKAEPRLARGLRITAAGELSLAVFDGLAVPMEVLRWVVGYTGPGSRGDSGAVAVLSIVVLCFMLLGATLFLIGISYQSVAMRLAAGRVWWQHLRAYRRLGPLWTLLHQHFPEIVLHRAPAGRLRDTLSLRA